MLEELLYLVKLDENSLPRVQSNLTSAMYLDIENGLKDEFRTSILRRIQAEPNVLAYNRLTYLVFSSGKAIPGSTCGSRLPLTGEPA
jgi:hypothetical protein